jgi:hypothetical protein
MSPPFTHARRSHSLSRERPTRTRTPRLTKKIPAQVWPTTPRAPPNLNLFVPDLIGSNKPAPRHGLPPHVAISSSPSSACPCPRGRTQESGGGKRVRVVCGGLERVLPAARVEQQGVFPPGRRSPPRQSGSVSSGQLIRRATARRQRVRHQRVGMVRPARPERRYARAESETPPRHASDQSPPCAGRGRQAAAPAGDHGGAEAKPVAVAVAAVVAAREGEHRHPADNGKRRATSSGLRQVKQTLRVRGARARARAPPVVPPTRAPTVMAIGKNTRFVMKRRCLLSCHGRQRTGCAAAEILNDF